MINKHVTCYFLYVAFFIFGNFYRHSCGLYSRYTYMYDIMLYLVVILCNSFSTFNIMYINVVCTYSSDEEFTALCGNELFLLESCLRVNPKSYGVWLHRQWVMTTSPQPDWKNEKKLCDLFLNYDERNCKYHVAASI